MPKTRFQSSNLNDSDLFKHSIHDIFLHGKACRLIALYLPVKYNQPNRVKRFLKADI